MNSESKNKYLFYSGIISGVVFCLLFAWQSKEKLCVKSNIVKRVFWNDILIPSCSTQQSAAWSKELIHVSSQIDAILKPLSHLKFKNSLIFTFKNNANKIHPQSDIFFNTSELGSDNLPIQVLRQRLKELNPELVELPLLWNTIAQFEFYINYGRIADIEFSKSATKIFWKPIQNTSHSECFSTWEITTKWQLCLNRNYQIFDTHYDFIQERLIHKFARIWINAYENLNLKEKYQLISLLDSRVLNYKNNQKNKKMPSFIQLSQEMNRFWLDSVYFPKSNSLLRFVATVVNDLETMNFTNIVDQTRFHLVYFNERINPNLLPSLLTKKDSQKGRDLVAVSNGKEFSILPFNKTIHLSSFFKWTADQVVVETCQPLTMKNVFNFFQNTEKLLVIYNCNPFNSEKISQIISEGIQSYAQKNSDDMFVHFHLPSLLTRKDKIDSKLEIFQFLTQRDKPNSIYEVFGWKELNWDQITKTYQPKAVVDAVDIFRAQ